MEPEAVEAEGSATACELRDTVRVRDGVHAKPAIREARLCYGACMGSWILERDLSRATTGNGRSTGGSVVTAELR